MPEPTRPPAAVDTAPQRACRIGIDVGGTFTKAVLIDNATHAVIGRYSVHTTHDHPRGVAHGVVEVFRNVLERSGVTPAEVVFIAHSTTQATNALLEGDVAPVGIIAMSGRAAARLAEPQGRIAPIELGPGRRIETSNRFLVTDEIDDADVRTAIAALQAEGARVLVASAAFGVDDTGTEELVRRIGTEAGLDTTCGHEITRLYGLALRTRTAAINASILPRMIATATMTAQSVAEAGIAAPLMIMRGDGGVMDIREMRRRPVMTMLSGPAASVAGALMHLKVADGLYFEVGGTSTNIGVIRNGRPTVTYARVGGHETCVASVDVRVLGIAGGSLIRATPGHLVDVGPRSAHIAGLPYAAFADASTFDGATLELFEPKPGDGADHVAIRTRDGRRFALTTTCASNALGLAPDGTHACGNRAAARAAFAPLAAFLRLDVDAATRAVLQCATDKILPVVDSLTREYHLDADQRLLVGEGGGAAALIPFVSQRTGLPFEIARDAEVISSIGVALALVRETVERVIPHPRPEDLTALRNEALEAAVRLGADRSSVDVTIEIDRTTHRITATALGAAEMRVKDAGGAVSESEARAAAARSLGVPADGLLLAATLPGFRIYRLNGEPQGPVRAVDREGAIRIQRRRALLATSTPPAAPVEVARLWQAAVDEGDQAPAALFLLHGHHVVDLSSLETADQALALAATELSDEPATAPVAIIAVRHD